MSRRRAEQIERLERDGVMASRREQLLAWFRAHPRGTPQQAVLELRYTHADHMYVVADSVRMDLLRGQAGAGTPAGRKQGTEGGTVTVNAGGAGQPPPPEASRRLPGWARDMAGQYPAYEFAPCKAPCRSSPSYATGPAPASPAAPAGRPPWTAAPRSAPPGSRSPRPAPRPARPGQRDQDRDSHAPHHPARLVRDQVPVGPVSVHVSISSSGSHSVCPPLPPRQRSRKDDRHQDGYEGLPALSVCLT